MDVDTAVAKLDGKKSLVVVNDVRADPMQSPRQTAARSTAPVRREASRWPRPRCSGSDYGVVQQARNSSNTTSAVPSQIRLERGDCELAARILTHQ